MAYRWRSAWALAPWIGIAWTLVATACSPPDPAGRPLRLEHVQPENNEGVYLNEDLVFTFSRPVDLSSITRESIQVVGADGRHASGRWRVEGRMVHFQPDPVLSPGLEDGGYRPGSSYTVRIAGFPRLDGIRSEDGAPLEASFVWGFRTVEVGEREGFVFDDASPGTADMLQLADQPQGWVSGPAPPRVRIGPRDSFFLVCKEPLDPSTLFDDDFTLHGGDRAVGVHTRFLSNADVGESARGDACAVIEVIPRRALEPGAWQLRLAQDLRLQDFGGNPIWRPFGVTLGQQIEVVEAASLEGRGEVTFAFLDDDRFSPIPVPGFDGTAHWDASGRVSLRFPAAAGTGAAGEVHLAGTDSREDIHATHLFVERETRLSPGSGLRVLRAQGRVEISGTLLREDTYAADDPPPGLSQDLSVATESLSDWLLGVEATGQDWTVIIAGGDLLITGGVRVDTPLLLVAGGRLRLQGDVRAREQELWLLGGGGGLGLRSQPSVARLVLDEPITNPLRVPLRFAAVSSPVPNVGRPARWLSSRAAGWTGAGSWRVRYLPAQNPLRFDGAVDDPRMLDGKGPIRLFVELEVGPGERWDPPFVNFVRLTWDEDLTDRKN